MGIKTKNIAYIRCRGGSPLREGVESSSLPSDCNAILEMYSEGISKCRYGCLGGGSCVSACRLGALSIGDRGIPEVDAVKCAGCGLCVRVCPQNLIDLINCEANIQPACSNRDAGKESRAVCTDSCIACRICEKNCPADAILVIDNHAVIDQGKCIRCGMCAIKCPRGVIRDAHGIMTD